MTPDMYYNVFVVAFVLAFVVLLVFIPLFHLLTRSTDETKQNKQQRNNTGMMYWTQGGKRYH